MSNPWDALDFTERIWKETENEQLERDRGPNSHKYYHVITRMVCSDCSTELNRATGLALEDAIKSLSPVGGQ